MLLDLYSQVIRTPCSHVEDVLEELLQFQRSELPSPVVTAHSQCLQLECYAQEDVGIIMQLSAPLGLSVTVDPPELRNNSRYAQKVTLFKPIYTQQQHLSTSHVLHDE